MKILVRCCSTFALWASLLEATLLAQTTAFTYQGQLSAGGGSASGSYDFRFRLAADALGNNYVGSPFLTNAVPVSNGLFTVIVDFGPGSFAGTDSWLEVNVRTNGGSSYTTLVPLQPITPAPNALFAQVAGSLNGPVSAAQLNGFIPSGNLAGSYGNPVTLNNAANSFSGNGAGLINVNASTLGGVGASGFWKLGGNTVSAGQFLGSANNQPLELNVNSQRAFRLEPNPGSAPNVIGGSRLNYVSNGIAGATIAGGGGFGTFSYPYYASTFTNSSSNVVSGSFGSLGGGGQNVVSGLGATVAGGYHNVAAGTYATVAGGYYNFANGDFSVVGGGSAYNYGNFANGAGSTVAGGTDNFANGESSSVVGGYNNWISTNAYAGFIGGGNYNQVTNSYAAVPGGSINIAGGKYSFAAGQLALAVHDGTFVWSDFSSYQSFASTSSNQFLIRALGGVGIGVTDPAYSLDVGGRIRLRGTLFNNSAGEWFYDTGTGNDRAFLGLADFGLLGFYGNTGAGWGLLMNTTNGYVGIGNGQVSPAHLLQVGNAYCDGNTWSPASDRNLKSGFAPVNTGGILAKVTDLPITQWHYTNDPATLHIGPVAQDFRAAFGLGKDDKHISDVDEGGVALAAIQGLNQRLSEELARRDRENAELRQRLELLEQKLAAGLSQPAASR